MVGIGLVFSLGTIGLFDRDLLQTHYLTADFRDKLHQAMTSSMESLESLPVPDELSGRNGVAT